ncbi:Pentatricopeptide repeat-containing protein [Hordeum vulgare]|nr:Pentatricopeptide repeat-containing protein [Hordeum vulgare]
MQIPTQPLTLFIMQIDTENKEKEEVPSKERDKGKGVVPLSEVTHVKSLAMDDDVQEEPLNGKRWNYDHYHEVTVNQGWVSFAVVHQIKIAFMVTFKLSTPDMLKVIVLNDYGIEVVTICRRHDDAFAVNA